MKNKIVFYLLLCCFQYTANAQYWQQKVDYTLEVSLNDKEKVLDGFEKIVYTNNSPDTLTYIWFNLWPNAYKNDKTALSDQLLENGSTNFYFSSKEQRGYINRLDFKVDGVTAKTEDHPQYIDIIKLILPTPLPPSQQITITTPFHEKLPFNFSRGGYDGQSFQLTQWYPKPAVYDVVGWHPIPYLDQGEFYSEFGSFDVRITLPKDYIVAATGQLQHNDEIVYQQPPARGLVTHKMGLKKLKPKLPGKITTDHPSITRTPVPPKQLPKINIHLKPKIALAIGTKTLEYKQDSVHDFAWFADKKFIVNTDTCRLGSGRIINVATYYTESQKNSWKHSVQFCKDAIRFYSKEVGEYPYATISAVQGPESFGGGMEYPTITIIAPMASEKNLDVTLTHEIGHNWFYGVLATNERQHPWMDEGINSFYEYKYARQKYGDTNQEEELLFQTKAKRKTDQPIETPSQDFSVANYALVAYHKTAKWMQLLEQKLGKDTFKETMQQYFQQWKFKHPQPQDFEHVFEQAAGTQVDTLFTYLHTKGLLPGEQYPGWKVLTPFTPKVLTAYINKPTKHLLTLSSVIGANNYDKLMVGGVITNYILPPSNLQFIAIPLYGIGSKHFTGIGRLNYTFYPAGSISMANIFVNAATFSMDKFTDVDGHTTYLKYQKLVPGIRLRFKEKDPRSTVMNFLEWKTYFIGENELQFYADSSISGADTIIKTSYHTPLNSRYLNQLQWVYNNYRALYPFSVMARIEQAKDFIKPTVTANYFFNYAKESGLNVRLFAGKFFYSNGKTSKKQFDTERYQLNLSGPNGYEDYTYSDYFIGRNNFEGIGSQQLMIRDGAFKVRTDLLADKVGKTDDWLVAANFNSIIPDKFNPLSALPIKIPLHLFADVGTYADAWKNSSATGRFLFDAGLHIPLLYESINIYIPLVYSSVFSDYYKSTMPKNRLLKTISFSINLNTKIFKRINNEVEF